MFNWFKKLFGGQTEDGANETSQSNLDQVQENSQSMTEETSEETEDQINEVSDLGSETDLDSDSFEQENQEEVEDISDDEDKL